MTHESTQAHTMYYRHQNIMPGHFMFFGGGRGDEGLMGNRLVLS